MKYSNVKNINKKNVMLSITFLPFYVTPKFMLLFF